MTDLFGLPEIYVDELFYREAREAAAFAVGARNGHRWCHLWPSEISEAGVRELHALAATLGLKRSWFQETQSQVSGRFPHYDLTPGKRAMAIRAGAKPVSLSDWLRAQIYGRKEMGAGRDGRKLQTPNFNSDTGAVRVRPLQAKLFE